MAASFLIEPGELLDAVRAGALLIDARKREAFTRAHIPGAVPFSTYDLFVPDTTLDGMKAFAANMAFMFGTAGVTLERPVVVYDDDTGMRAARELWILEYLGHRNVRMLHGGYRQWLAEGGIPESGDDVKTTRPKRLQALVASGGFSGADEILRRGGNESFVIIDTRTDLEWAGKDSTPCCARHGRIPNAVHIEWLAFMQDGRFKSPDAILAVLARHGVDPHAEVVTYCHRGARSAAAYFALRLAGCSGARNYIGSWHEWAARDFPAEG
jgi:thiosulfate/3-mercaptopyruvate sulfurtransferase